MVMRLSSAVVADNSNSSDGRSSIPRGRRNSSSQQRRRPINRTTTRDDDHYLTVVHENHPSSVKTPLSRSYPSYLKDKKAPTVGLLTWRSLSSRTTTSGQKKSIIQRRVQWVIGSVCAFVTLQFLWTLAMFVSITSQYHHGDGPHHTSSSSSFPSSSSLSKSDNFNDVGKNVMEVLIHHTTEGGVFTNGLLSSLRGSRESDHGIVVDDDYYYNYKKYSILFPSVIKDHHVEEDSPSLVNRLPPFRREPGRDFGGLRLSNPLEKTTRRRTTSDGGEHSIYQRRILEDNDEPTITTQSGHVKQQDSGEKKNLQNEDSSSSFDEYYAFDDDAVRAETTAFNEQDEEDLEHFKTCRRTHVHRLSFPVCNGFHELDYVAHPVQTNFKFLNNGSFRQVFAYQHFLPPSASSSSSLSGATSAASTVEQVAVKEIVYEEIDTDESPMMDLLEYVRMDAIVAERLTASPRIYDIYGYCGLSILSEFFPHGDMEEMSWGEHSHIRPKDLHDEDDVKSQNHLTPRQKLYLALDMAEGLADLHGYPESLIIHDDVQLSQFLLNADKTQIKSNDFNRAEFALWDDQRGAYCRYQNGHGAGSHRSPEEYLDKPLTEAIDVWSYGNNLYTILTGLDPFYELDNRTGKQLHHAKLSVPKGLTAYIDPRYEKHSDEERVLVQLIRKCFQYLPKDRPTIFDIVAELRKAVDDITIKDEHHNAVHGRLAALRHLPPPSTKSLQQPKKETK